MNALTLCYLRMILEYNPDTGVWNWCISKGSSNRKPGDIAGYIHPKGYRIIKIDGKNYLSGRLAWFYMTGNWPFPEIDHIDRNPSNDKWSNLREASRVQQNINRDSYNKLGVKGVEKIGNRYRASIKINGKNVRLGSFITLDAAIEAFEQANRERTK